MSKKGERKRIGGTETITHEEARRLMQVLEADDVYETELLAIHKEIATYITQQEKQDKYTTDLINIAQSRLKHISHLETELSKTKELFKLYRKYFELDKKIENKHLTGKEELGIIYDKKILEQQIKELENEDIGFTTEIINLSELEK